MIHGARPRYAKSREAILQAISRLILSGAKYTDLNVGQIAEEAGVSRSTYYLHFESKRALIEVLIDMFREEFAEWGTMTDDMFTNPTPEVIRLSLIQLARLYRKNVALFQAIYEASATDAALSKAYHDMICATVTQREAQLRKQKRAGTVPKDLTKTTPLVLTWMVERAISQHITAETQEDITSDRAAMELVDGLAEVVWKAYYA